jgi:hypothetical protein
MIIQHVVDALLMKSVSGVLHQTRAHPYLKLLAVIVGAWFLTPLVRIRLWPKISLLGT